MTTDLEPTPAAPQPAPRAVLARYGVMRVIGAFETPVNFVFRKQETAFLQTDRGLEAGELLCPATPQALKAIPEPTRGKLIRLPDAGDLAKLKLHKENEAKEFTRAVELVKQHKLAMQLVHGERLFGNERSVFYFLSEIRVDFRDLVKSMAREFHTRIELRQVGVRDEAKLIADYGDCGKPVCCNTHMVVMPPVSMRMAKLQKSTLDPTKISGRCGRLKCCLRFEQDVYEEFQDQLPPVGSRVVTDKGQGKVLAQEVLARRLLIEFEDGRRLPVPLADILTRL